MAVTVYHSKQVRKRLAFSCHWVIGGPLREMHNDLPTRLVRLLGGQLAFEDHLSSAEISFVSTKSYSFSLQLFRTQVVNSNIDRSQAVNVND